MGSLDDSYFIHETFYGPDMHAPMSDEAYLIGVALFPVLLWGLATGQTG